MSKYDPNDYNGDGKIDCCDMEFYHMWRSEEEKRMSTSTSSDSEEGLGILFVWLFLALVLSFFIPSFLISLVVSFFLVVAAVGTEKS